MLIKRWNKERNCFVYDVRIRDEYGKKRLYATGLSAKGVAKEYERKKLNEIAERRLFPERFIKERKFSEFVDEYLKKHAEHIRSTRNYKSTAKILIEFFGDKYLHEIQRYDIETYRSARLKKVDGTTVDKDLAILKGIFTKAVEWGFLLKNPVKGIKIGRGKPRTRYLTKQEINDLISKCRAGYLRSMVIIDINTGLRKSELLRLKWEDINTETNVIKVEEGKGGYTRYVPINDTVIHEVFSLKLKEKGQYVFHDPAGKPFDDVKKSFQGAVGKAKLTDVRFHDLRRTFATICAMKNVPPKTLQKWLGHKSIETTMKYYVVSPDDFEQEAIKRLDSIVDSPEDTPKNLGIGDTSQSLENIGADAGSRTPDLLITSELLYP